MYGPEPPLISGAQHMEFLRLYIGGREEIGDKDWT